jgi:hypothetical protein
MMCVTGHLQKNGLADESSVTVKKLNGPAMGGWRTGGRPDEPARSGGVWLMLMRSGPQEDSGAPAGFGGKLDTADVQMRKPSIGYGNDAGGDAGAAERFGRGPEERFVVARAKEQEPIQRQSESRGGRWKKLPLAIAPGDPPEPAGGFGQQHRQKKRRRTLGQKFMNRPAAERPAGHKPIQRRHPGLNGPAGAQGRGLVPNRPRVKDLQRAAAG